MTKGNVRIRPVGEKDFGAVAELLAELGRPALTPETTEAARKVYDRHLLRSDTASLVAERNGDLIGFLALEFRDRLNRVRPQAWIPDLIVTSRHRGQGIGRILLDAAFAKAREHGCWSVTLESGYQRTAAHRLYTAVGMEDAGKFFVYLL